MLKKKRKPVHPGKILKEMFLIPLAINQTACALNLGIARKTLSLLLHERQRISVEMAVRLAKAFRTTPEFWMNLQCRYDVWYASRNGELSKIRAYGKVKARAGGGGGRWKRSK